MRACKSSGVKQLDLPLCWSHCGTDHGGLPGFENIEDAFPCSYLQKCFMALATRQPRSYFIKYLFKVPRTSTWPACFRAASERTIEICSNSRTRFIKVADTQIRVLLENDVRWESSQNHYFNYPLVPMSSMMSDEVDIRVFHHSSVLSESLLQAILHLFDHVVQQLIDRQSEELPSISIVGDWDVQHAINSHNLKPVTKACVHRAIDELVRTRPDAEAVVSRDHNLSYAELGNLASRLAKQLQDLGVGPEVLVVFCFPKSACRPNLGFDTKSTNIGYPLTNAYWVVESADPKHSRLPAFGSTMQTGFRETCPEEHTGLEIWRDEWPMELSDTWAARIHRLSSTDNASSWARLRPAYRSISRLI